MSLGRLGPFSRLLALVLSWAVPATTVWASAPPVPPAPAVHLIRPQGAVHVPVSRELANRWAEPADMAAASDASWTRGLTELADPDPAAAASGGVVVGSVVSDATGLPLAGAGVRLVGSPDAAVPTDLDGRYLVPVPAGEAVLVIEKEGFVPVERRAAVASGAGARAPDARLTPLATPVTVSPAGGSVPQGPVRLSVPPGAVSTDTGFILTLLSPQGLPGRLPLGWASAVGFDLRAGRPVTGSLTATVRELPSGTVHLVAYQDHAWRLLSSHTVGITGELGLSLEGLGAFALVRADDGGPVVPGIGEVLPGVDAVALPSGITGTAVVVPAQVPATGATALGRVSLVSPQALPSGSAVEARSVESFTVDGVSFTDEERVQDVVVQRSEPNAGTSLRAEFPLTALRTFDATVPVHGRLHLEVWARGDSAGPGTVGGQDAVSLESGVARLDVTAGSLAENTLIRFAWIGLDSFLPVGAGYAALGEVMVDFSGATLSSSAELSLLDPGVGTDTVVVAKVERYEGVPYLSVVSLAERLNGRLVSRPYPGLPGIVRGGKYVFYRLTNPVGFVAGTTTSPLGPVQAVVSPEGLPFVGISDGAGAYITASPVGSVRVRAFVPRTPHQAEGVVTVTANQTTSLNLILSGGLTTVVVTPEDGSIGVPVSSSVQIETSQPLAPGSVSPSSVKLYQGNPSQNQALAVRLVLSVSGKSLAVIPETALLPATAYTLRVSGLVDAYGGPVSMPDVRFTTRANDEPSYDLSRIVFSFPDENGMIQVHAPAGTLAAASTVLIVNSDNGVVLSLTADNDGALSGELPGSLDDRMLVTVTDPLGRTQSLTITKYVDLATGRTSIGATGGVVEGPGGVELRLPDGAVDRGVVFKIQAVSPASIPVNQRPQIPDSHLGAVLQIEAPSMPRFRKEVDLVFPKPADAPAGAFYYVYRKILGPDGVVIHEALDSASVQGAKVVTNSPPFSGYTDSVGAFAFGFGGLAIAGVASSITYLMWTIDQLVPGRASAGAISGSVLCGRWNRSTGQYDYVGVPGAIVRPIWGEQDPVLAGGTVTRSGGDGGYAFFEGRYSGGGIKLRATIPASLVGCAGTKDAMGYGAPKPTWALSYTAYATANITFTAEGEPPPEPRVDIRLLKQVDGAWRFSEGVETTGQALLIGITVAEATLSEARVDGDLLTLRDAVPEHLGMAQVADYTPGTTGVHTVTVKVNPAQGSPVTVSSSFLAIADGSDNNTPLPGRPEVIALASVPRHGATSVPVTVLPEIRFTEPVKNVPGNLILTAINSDGTAGDAVSFGLFGAGPDGPVTEVTALSKVSSLTLQPTNSLEHGKKYRLSLTDAIVDLDPDPEGSQPLVPFASEFETYDPTVVGTSGETYTSAGVVVSGERAYVLENQFERGLLRTYDVSDPEQPRELGGPWMVLGRAVDLKGEKASPVLPENPDIVVAGTTVNWRSRPSNLHVYDVSSGRPWEIGAVSVSASSLAGTLSRFVVKGTRAFTITWHRGVQEVDLTRAVQNYQATDFFTRNRDMNTSGRGFGMNAVMQTIPVLRAPNQHWLMRDLKVGDYVQDGQSQPIVWVTGDLGLAWVNPQAGGHGPPLTLSLATGRRLGEGTALALGRLGSQDVAVVVGGGVIKDANGVEVPGSVLAVVDLGEVLHPSTPAKPKVLSIIPLFGGDFVLGGQPQDVLLVEHMAVVSSATNAVIVDLGTGETAGTAPAVIGALDGVAGRLTLGDDGLLYSSAYSVLGGQDPLGGLKVSALGKFTVITAAHENPVILDIDRTSVETQTLKYKVIPKPAEVQSAELEVVQATPQGETVYRTLPASLDAQGKGQLTLPAGVAYPLNKTVKARLVVNRDDPQAPRALAKVLRGEAFKVDPDEPETVTTGLYDFLELSAVNPAILERLGENRDPGYRPPALSWRTNREPAPGAYHVDPYAEIPREGIYYGEFQASRVGIYDLDLIDENDRLLARTASVEVLAGPARSATVLVGAPPQSPDLFGRVPADGMTTVELVLTDIKDGITSDANVINDERAVQWQLVEGDGELLDGAESKVVNGQAHARYRAGIEPGDAKVVAVLDGQTWEATIRQSQLTLTLRPAWPLLEATVTSDAGSPMKGTPIAWGTLTGSIGFIDTLEDSKSQALWSLDHPRRRPGDSPPKKVMVFFSIGRERFEYQRDMTVDEPGGMYLRWDRSRYVFDPVVSPASPAQGGEGPLTGPSSAVSTTPQAVTEIGGGQPGAQVRLQLGTEHHPVVAPVAAFALDAIETTPDGPATPDVLGGPGARVADAVTVDNSELAFPAALRFVGTGGLSLAEGPATALRQEFGWNGWVNFDSLTSGQVVVEKAGSYGLGVVEEQGQPYLEFYAFAAGVRKRVLSPAPLSAGRWYHFAAHARGGRLWLSIGVDEAVKIGDGLTGVDVTASPILIGASLQGRLDELAAYDFTRSSFLSFEDGSTDFTVTLDGEGRASVPVFAHGTTSGAFASASPFMVAEASAAGEPGELANPFANQLHTGTVRVFQAPDPDVLNPSLSTQVKSFFRQQMENCEEGLSSGETPDWASFACELGVGLWPPAAFSQATRDLYYVNRHFQQGKRSVGDYIKGTFAIVGIIATVVPVVRGLKRSYVAGRAAMAGRKIEAVLAREAAETIGRKLINSEAEAASGPLLKLLEGGETQGRGALLKLWGACTLAMAVSAASPGQAAWGSEVRGVEAAQVNAAAASCTGLSTAAWGKLARIGKRWSGGLDDFPEEVIVKLSQLADEQSERFGYEIVERMIHAMDDSGIRKLSPEALEGLAVLVKNSKAPSRLRNSWGEFKRAFPATPAGELQAHDKMDLMFRWLKRGEETVPPIAGWKQFVAEGAGTCVPCRSTQGFFHHLENLAADGFRDIAHLDEKVPLLFYKGRPDVLKRVQGAANKFIQEEYKSLLPGRLLGGKAKAQLRGNIKMAIERATNRATNPTQFATELADELSRIKYIIRGAENAHVGLRSQVKKIIEESIGDPALKQLADQVTRPGANSFVVFQGKGIPF